LDGFFPNCPELTLTVDLLMYKAACLGENDQI
jgi:hypothetical protein